jgi:hypothetical protein
VGDSMSRFMDNYIGIFGIINTSFPEAKSGRRGGWIKITVIRPIHSMGIHINLVIANIWKPKIIVDIGIISGNMKKCINI